MAELPRYVKGYAKPNGRVFFYYERYRGTARAWPRTPLPFDPQAPEFWARCRQYEALDASPGPQGWVWRWLASSGRPYDLPDPKAGIEAFWKALAGAEAADRDRAAGENKTFRALIADYKEHRAFQDLGAGTRRDYERFLAVIRDAWGDDPVRNLKPEEAQAAIDAYQDTPASARYFRAVLSRLVAVRGGGPDPELVGQALARAQAMKRLRDEGLVFHGLRKNAVNVLLKVGCTEAQVSAIVEMSEQMVRHYSRDVNKRQLAVNAMKKLEDGWKDVRRTLFGAPRRASSNG